MTDDLERHSPDRPTDEHRLAEAIEHVEEVVDHLEEVVHGRTPVAFRLRWPISARVTASLLALLLVVIVFAFTTHGQLLNHNNIIAILSGASQLGIITVGVTLLMIGGEYDLSVGQTFVLSGMVTGLALPHMNQVLAILCGLLAALAVGLFNGIATVYLGLPSFISTLGSFFGLSGIVLIISSGTPVTPTGSYAFYSVLNKSVGNGGLKLQLFWWIGIALVAAVFLERSRFGNHVFATGGDRVAAASTGVRTGRVRIVLFALCSVLAGFAGIVQLSDIATMSADAGGGYNLEAIAAAVIGGASLFGGVGGVIDGVIGTVFLGMVSTALILSGADPLYYQLFVGLAVVASVSVYLRGSSLWNAVVGMRSLRRVDG
jgi:simple sugar transport system permease protein